VSHPRRFSILSAAVGTVGLAIAFAVIPAASASADTGTVDGVTYDTTGSTASADAYSGSSATVVIPATVNIGGTDYTVTEVGNGAFDPSGHNTGTLLTSVTLPSTLETLDDDAFARNHITSIDFPDSVTDLGNAAFFQDDISSIRFPAGITTIAPSVFFDNQLTSLSLPSTVTTVGESAFSDNPITSLTLDAALVTIGTSAFQSEDFSTVTIPASVTSLGDYAFNTPTVTSATFLGAMPTVGTHLFGDSISPDLIVYYDVSYGDPPLVSGYTTPTWQANAADTGTAGPFNTEPIAVVRFMGNGGSSPADQTVLVGDTVTDPATSRAGYRFDGWFTAASGGTEWNFTDPVTNDLTLFAHWTQVPALASTGIDPLPVVPVGAVMLLLGLVLLTLARRRRRNAHV
jgi:uncharacterized repeat protein (TIGR02543 family)/MYXO-CTERM domain-containing protein